MKQVGDESFCWQVFRMGTTGQAGGLPGWYVQPLPPTSSAADKKATFGGSRRYLRLLPPPSVCVGVIQDGSFLRLPVPLCRLSCANRIFMFRFWPAGTALARVAGCGPRVGRCGPELARPCRTIACPVKCNPGPGANRVIQLFCIIFGVSLQKHCTTLWQQN